MSHAHETRVAAQFGPRAKAYVESAVHARGPDLDALEAVVSAARPARSLDLGAGGGHVSYFMARHARSVVAVDLSAEMLAAVRATASARGLDNIETAEAPAEKLPFEAGVFDFVASRYSAHHWRDFGAGLKEARRVASRGAGAVFIDAYSPGPALLDTHLQAIELLRDTSHVRDYTMAEWVAALAAAGFAIAGVKTFRIRMDYPVWIARMRTPDENARAIRVVQETAASETRSHFEIEADGSFMLDVMAIEAKAA
jgi:ubiquinone/menaquinone biosynthesis C-methylase UbiE